MQILRTWQYFCLSESEKRSAAIAKEKLAKQEQFAAKKKAAKDAKALAAANNGVPLSALLVIRDGGNLKLTQSDHTSEMVFTQRSLHFKNLLLETWNADSWRFKFEETKTVMIFRRRKEAFQIYSRVIALFTGMLEHHLPKNLTIDESNPILPDPRLLATSGYGGFILTSVAKYLHPSDIACAAGGIVDGALICASPEISAIYYKCLKKFIPVDWWNPRRVHLTLNKEKLLISKLCSEAEGRAKVIQAKNSKITKMKTSHLNFLKSARQVLIDITDKAKSMITHDKRQTLIL